MRWVTELDPLGYRTRPGSKAIPLIFLFKIFIQLGLRTRPRRGAGMKLRERLYSPISQFFYIPLNIGLVSIFLSGNDLGDIVAKAGPLQQAHFLQVPLWLRLIGRPLQFCAAHSLPAVDPPNNTSLKFLLRRVLRGDLPFQALHPLNEIIDHPAPAFCKILFERDLGVDLPEKPHPLAPLFIHGIFETALKSIWATRWSC